VPKLFQLGVGGGVKLGSGFYSPNLEGRW